MIKGKINPVKRLMNTISVLAVIVAILMSTVAFNAIVTPAFALDHSLDGFSGTASAQSGNVNPFSGTLSMQSGTASAQSGTANAQSGSMTSESGTASAQSGSAGQESGTASAQSGTASAQSGTLNAQSGTLSVQSGTASAQSGTLSIQSGTASAQSGTLSMQSGTLSMQSGTLNVQSGVITGFSGTLSMQSGTLSTQSGEAIDVSGTLSVQSGTLSMQSFTTNAESGTLNIQSGTMFIYSGTLNAQSGTYNVESGTLNIQSGTLSVQSGTLSVQSGTLNAQSGTLSAQSGETFQMSGTLSMQSGTLNAQSGVITGFSGTLSTQSGILTIHSGTLSAQSGTLNAQSGTLSTQSGDTLYVYSGTLSTQSGNFAVSGAINLGSGTLSVQSSLIVPHAGTLNAQSGTLNAQSGTLSVQSGTLSAQSGTLSTQSGTLSVQSGTLSAQSGTLNMQSGTASAQSGVVTDFSGTVTGLTGTLNAQSGAIDLGPGDTINVQSGTLSMQSGTLNAQSGTMAALSGTLFIFAGTLSMQSGETIYIDSGTLCVQSGTLNAQSGAVLIQCGTLNAQSGTLSMQSGTASAQSGTLVIDSGTLNAQSGFVDTKSGTIYMLKGTLSVQSGMLNGVQFTGTITGLSGTLSMQSGTLNAQSGTLSMQSGTLSDLSGTLNTQSDTWNIVSGTLSMQSGTLNAQSGTASAQSGFFAADPDSLSADAALGLQGKWFNLAFLDEPIAPTIEGLAVVNFTPNPSSYNGTTGLFHASAAEGNLSINTPTGINLIAMENVEVDYNDANYYYDYDTIPDMVVKGKFTLTTPLTASQLNAADWRNQYIEDFTVDRGEFHTVLIGSGPGYGNGKNYELYGRIYLYGTYKGEDRVLVTDFMNQLDFGVEGIGDCCHPMTDGRFHVEGDWYCYPGAYLMGWRAPKIWSTGDMTIPASGSTPVKLSYSSDYVYMPWLTQTFKVIENNGEWTLPAESIKNVITTKNNYVMVNRDELPTATGVYTGEVSAATSDGYVGINGYDHFKIVVSSDVSDINVRLAEMSDVHSAVMYATFPSQASDMTCEWNWGDGTVNTIGVPAGATTSTDMHIFEQAGEYPVRVTLIKGGTVVAKKAYCEYHGMTNFPWYDTQQALYRQYLGIKGLTPITVSQFENYLITRTYFCDNESSGLYTAKVYWGDGMESACGMYGINNRLVYFSDGVPRQDALSGLVRGGHVYNTPGTYEVRMVVYKNGAEFASAYTTVNVVKIHEWDGKTEYNGQLGMGQQLDNVYYTIDWGDDSVLDSGQYNGGRLQVLHTYNMGGFFTVNVSFWLGPSHTDLITSWKYDMLGVVMKGVDITAGGADIVRNGATNGTRDVSMGDAYTMSVDFPTIYDDGQASGSAGVYAEPGVSTPRLSAIFNWGDGMSSVDVVPDANGVVHCEDSHVYVEPGKYTPSVELVVDTSSTIGVGTSDMLDIRYMVGPIDVTVTGDTVGVRAGLPGGVSGLTADWTLVNKDDPETTYPGTSFISSTATEITYSFTSVSHGQYILTLELKDNSGATIFSEVYYYVSV